MAYQSESSVSGRPRSRLQGGRSTPSMVFDPPGELSAFPLIICPECHQARVVEGRTKKEGENHGRLYFKCARNGYPKLCGFYCFEKQYFQALVKAGDVVVPSWAAMDEDVDCVEGPAGDKKKAAVLEQKLDNVIWKMNLFFLCVASVVLGCVMMYVAMKV